MTEQEQQWLQQIREGSFAAFRELVQHHQERLFRLAYDFVGNVQDAQDVLQESLIKMFFSLKAFRGEAGLQTYFYRIVVNSCLDFLRKQKRERHRSLWGEEGKKALHIPDPEIEHNPELQMVRREFRQQIQKALAGLTPKERAVFILRYDHDLSVDEIATVLRVAPGTVKSLHFRGVRKLQKRLSPIYQEREDGR